MSDRRAGFVTSSSVSLALHGGVIALAWLLASARLAGSPEPLPPPPARRTS
jgi:hypothetical protein